MKVLRLVIFSHLTKVRRTFHFNSGHPTCQVFTTKSKCPVVKMTKKTIKAEKTGETLKKSEKKYKITILKSRAKFVSYYGT